MQRPPKKRISAEILNMIDKSTREAKVPSRDNERMESLSRNRPRQDATRVVPKRLFSDDIPHRRDMVGPSPKPWAKIEVPRRRNDEDLKPIPEYTPRRRR